MIVENPEALKAWLSRILEPMSDADPAYLSKYVLALLKKDKSGDELRETLSGNLDVFLQKGTQGFVDILMRTLEDKSYLNPTVDDHTAPDSTTTNSSSLSTASSANRLKSGDDKNSAQSGVSGGFGGNRVRSPHPPREGNVGSGTSGRRASRTRSRSPGHGRGGARDRKRDYRPGFREGQHRGDYRRRRGGGRMQRGRRSRSRSRSPVGTRIGQPGSPGPLGSAGSRRRRSRSRSRSWSPPRSRSAERFRGRSDSPFDEDRSGGLDRGFRRLCSDLFRRERCIDFDSKGLCVRGDQCPYDHGIDPVRVDGGALPQVLGIRPPGIPPSIVPPFPPPHLLMGPPPRMPVDSGGIPIPPPPLPPGIMPPMGVPPPMDVGPRPGFFSPEILSQNRMPFSPRMGRGGIRPPMTKRDPKNCTLELRRIPVKENDIVTLSSHFSKFGKVTNIQVNYNGEPGAALVTFATPAEAQAAFRSPDPVLNNRFIKIFWRDPDAGDSEEAKAFKSEELEQKAQEAKEQKAKEIAAIQKQQDLLLSRQTAKKLEEEKKKEVAKITTNLVKQRAMLLEKQLEQQKLLIAKLEQGKDTLPAEEKDKLRSTIRTLQSNIEATKRDIAAAGIVSGAPRSQPVVRAAASASGSPVATKIKTKQDIEKEMLDMELELYSKEGCADAIELEKKLLELKRLAVAMSYQGGAAPVPVKPPVSQVVYGRGRGGVRMRPYVPRGGRFAARGRGFTAANPFQSRSLTSLDNRPKRLCVSGYELEDKDELIRHFMGFGTIVSHTSDDTIPSVVLEFKSRAEAEVAALKGRHFRDRTLAVNWVHGGTVSVLDESGKADADGDDKDTGSTEDETDGELKPDFTVKKEEIQVDDSSEEDDVSVVTGGHKKGSVSSSLDENSLLGDDDGGINNEVSLHEELLLLGDDDDDEDEDEEDGDSRSWRR